MTSPAADRPQLQMQAGRHKRIRNGHPWGYSNEIVMTPFASLGPIDPSRTHPLLPTREGAPEAEPISVHDMRHAMQFIKEAAASGGGRTVDESGQIEAQHTDIVTALS